MTLESRLVDLGATARKLVDHGLVRGRGGNVSLRWNDQCYVSPTGAQLNRLSAGDFVPLNLDGTNTWQLRRASSESAMHLACYWARPDLQVVFHIHPPNCIALGGAGLSLKAISPDFYLAMGAEVPLLSFITPTTRELGEAVGKLMLTHDAVLLRNHGLILGAESIEEALVNSLIVEEAARIVLLAYAATGTCSYLSAEQIAQLEQLTGRYHGKKKRGTQNDE